jgi:hypothetical protein
MLDFYAREFIICVEMIGEIKVRVLGLKQFQNMSQEEANTIIERLQILRSHCVGLELTMAVAQTDRIFAARAGRQVQFLEFGQMLTALRERIDDQLTARVFFAIDSRNLGFFAPDPKANNRATLKSTEEIFGAAILRSFPSASDDLEEAVKCRCCDRRTATVFHLMRALEVAIRALGKSLNDANMDPARNPAWESILRRCDTELALPSDKRSSEWALNGHFYAELAADLRSIKTAWRNPTMHVDRSYTAEQASQVWNATLTFLQHASSKLHE